MRMNSAKYVSLENKGKNKGTHNYSYRTAAASQDKASISSPNDELKWLESIVSGL